jgi:fatty acid-binding protein DegV
LKELAREQGPLRDLAVMHTHVEDTAQDLADEFREEYPSLQHPIYVLEVTTALGTHVGPNALGVACVRVNS